MIVRAGLAGLKAIYQEGFDLTEAGVMLLDLASDGVAAAAERALAGRAGAAGRFMGAMLNALRRGPPVTRLRPEYA